jgi:hypothetical protein
MNDGISITAHKKIKINMNETKQPLYFIIEIGLTKK